MGDTELNDLASNLILQAGMMMEDRSVQLITRPTDLDALDRQIEALQDSATKLNSLAKCALTLVQLRESANP